MKRVFISYSHKDEEWKDRLVTHLGVLEKQGDLEIPRMMADRDFLDKTIYVTSEGKGNRFALDGDDLAALKKHS